MLAIAAAPAAAQTTAPPPATIPPAIPVDQVPTGTAFDGAGMWIWYVSRSSGGSISRIARRARKAGITTVFIKSSDGSDTWSQFTKRRVDALHRRGLKV